MVTGRCIDRVDRYGAGSCQCTTNTDSDAWSDRPDFQNHLLPSLLYPGHAACVSYPHAVYHYGASLAFLCKIYLLLPKSFTGSAQSSWNSYDRRIIVDLSLYRGCFCTKRLWSVVSGSARPLYRQSPDDPGIDNRGRLPWYACLPIKK